MSRRREARPPPYARDARAPEAAERASREPVVSRGTKALALARRSREASRAPRRDVESWVEAGRRALQAQQALQA